MNMLHDASIADLRLGIHHFYRRPVQVQDDGEVEQFVAMFTDNAEFGHGRGETPVRTRANITAAATEFRARMASKCAVNRDLFNSFVIEGQDDATIRADR